MWLSVRAEAGIDACARVVSACNVKGPNARTHMHTAVQANEEERGGAQRRTGWKRNKERGRRGRKARKKEKELDA